MNLRCSIFGHDRIFARSTAEHLWAFWRPWHCSRCPARFDGCVLPPAPPVPPTRCARERLAFVTAIVEASGEPPSLTATAAAYEAMTTFRRFMRGPPPENEDR
jgi:hypothetical protein